MIYLRASARRGPDGLWRGKVRQVWHGPRGFGRILTLRVWNLGSACSTESEAAAEADSFLAEYIAAAPWADESLAA